MKNKSQGYSSQSFSYKYLYDFHALELDIQNDDRRCEGARDLVIKVRFHSSFDGLFHRPGQHMAVSLLVF